MVPKWSKSDLSCSKWSKNADKWPRSIIFKKWAKIWEETILREPREPCEPREPPKPSLQPTLEMLI